MNTHAMYSLKHFKLKYSSAPDYETINYLNDTIFYMCMFFFRLLSLRKFIVREGRFSSSLLR